MSIGNFPAFARNGGMMHDYHETLCRRFMERRRERLARVRTAEDARMYVEEVRRKLSDLFGRLPDRTPLNPRMTGRVEHPELRIEKIVFESRPGLWVTALFYIRKEVWEKLPGVLFLHGHSDAGKMAPHYQEVAQRIALSGYAVLAVDPIGQGERAEWEGMPCTEQHSAIGDKMLLAGDFFGRYRLHDAVRGLDYLLSRSEVDSGRVGVTGTSGGGTMTTYLTAFDRRVTMSAPSSCLSTWLSHMENDIFADMEQTPCGFLEQELDLGDYLIAGAPCPTVILAQDNDFNDLRGVETLYREVKRIYGLLGRESALELFPGHGDHGYSEGHQLAAIRFFDRCCGRKILPETLPPVLIFRAEELYCVPGGNGIRAGGKRILDFVREDHPLPDKRPIRSRREWTELCSRILKLKDLERIPSYTCLRRQMLDPEADLCFARFGIRSEPGITAVLKMLSRGIVNRLIPQKSIVLYLGERDTAEESIAGEFFGMGPCACFALDVRMIGENHPEHIIPGLDPASETDVLHGVMRGRGVILGRPNLGGQVQDVIRTAMLLHSAGAHEIHLAGRGRGALHALLAALFLAPVKRVSLWSLPPSWTDSFRDPDPSIPSTSYAAHGVLTHFDFPEVISFLRDSCGLTVDVES